MSIKTLIASAFVCLFHNIAGYSQGSTRFEPVFWLYNPQEIKESSNDFHTLNFHSRLFMDDKNTWSSVKKISSSNQLFVVYKSKQNENLVSFIGKKQAVFLDGKNMFVKDSVNLDGYNEPYGELLDARFSNSEDGTFWMNPDLQQSSVFELILVDKKMAPAAVNEVRTYLSLKYGVSLVDHSQYTYRNQSLWEGSNNTYNHHIFGLARMGYFNLNLSQSTHSRDKDLIVSLASPTQRGQMNEGTYVLFGNNRRPFVFDRKTKFNTKQWLVQTNKDLVKVDVSFPLSRLGTTSDTFNVYELLTTGTGTETSYTGRIRDSLLVFRNVAFSNTGHTVVKLREHLTDFKWETENGCDEFRLKLKSPLKPERFELSLTDDKGKTVLTERTFKEVYTVSGSKSTYFDVLLSYNGKQVSRRIETRRGTLNMPELKEVYELREGTVNIHLNNPKQYGLQWFRSGKVVGNGNEVKLNEEGLYSLNVSDSGGCSFSQQFSVRASFNQEQWRLFPNPASINDEVQAAFNLVKESTVEIAVYQGNGKLIKTVSPGSIQNATVNLGQFAVAPGVYMVVAYIDAIPQFKKIIIK